MQITAEQLKLAGQRFNLVLGDNGMRIFLLLATAAIGGRASFLDKGPRLPAFSRATAQASKRTGVKLRAMAQVRTVALAENELVIGLAPTVCFPFEGARTTEVQDGNRLLPQPVDKYLTRAGAGDARGKDFGIDLEPGEPLAVRRDNDYQRD
jgi:hypothetical protein